MTRYKRRATRNETMRDLIAEVRALRAEIAVLSAERVQVVPMPYPQPYPVPQPYNPYQWPQRYWTAVSSPNISISGFDSGSVLTTQIAANVTSYNVGD